MISFIVRPIHDNNFPILNCFNFTQNEINFIPKEVGFIQKENSFILI